MTLRRERSRRLLLAAGFGLAALLWCGVLANLHLSGRASILDRIEAPLLDLRFLIAGPRTPSIDIVVVALDDATVREAGRFPLPRATIAELVRALARLDARAIGLDILFIDPGPPEDDAALAAALRDARAVIAAAGLFRPAAAPVSGLRAVAEVIRPVEPLRDAAAFGLVNVATDHAGTPRHVPLLLRYGDEVLPSFPLRLAARAASEAVELGADRVSFGAAETRTDIGLHLPLRFAGPRGTLPTVSARAVLRGEVPRSAIAGRVVVVGATALGTSDTFATPFDPVLPGVEIMAAAVAHLLAGDGLVRDRRVRQIDVAAALALSLGAVLAIAFLPLGPALVATGLAALLWLVATALAFGSGYWLSAVLPLAALAVPAALCAAARQGLDQLHTRRVLQARDALRRFQSPALADRIARDPGFLAKPVEQDAAILFVDLSNFTRLSERLGPGRTRDLLSRYHTILEDEVTLHGGLVLSFMGDGAMVAFGLPEASADDAERALETAFAMATSVRAWLDTLVAIAPTELVAALDVRIGVHYGPVVVSRLGSRLHQHITATGDCVNVTSRLLEVASQRGAMVVASQALLDASGDAAARLPFAPLQAIPIRGREQSLTVALWTPPQMPARHRREA
ncbi:MAG TPA: adenylate/guanylate cyclase domain-containing protein [Microvirga sp.]